MVWHIYIRNSIDRSSSTIPRRRVNLIFQTEMMKKKKNLMLLFKFVIEKVAGYYFTWDDVNVDDIRIWVHSRAALVLTKKS